MIPPCSSFQTTRSKCSSLNQRRRGSSGICRTLDISRSMAVSSILHADVARLGEEAHGLETPLAADAGLLHAAHGHPEVPEHPAVYPDESRFQIGRASC